MSKLEETLTKDNKRMRLAEGKADALAWDINQSKEARKVRVKLRVRVRFRVRVKGYDKPPRQDKTSQDKTQTDNRKETDKT